MGGVTMVHPGVTLPPSANTRNPLVQLGVTLPRRATAALYCNKVQLRYIPGDNMVCKTNRFLIQNCRSSELSFEAVHLKTLL